MITEKSLKGFNGSHIESAVKETTEKRSQTYVHLYKDEASTGNIFKFFSETVPVVGKRSEASGLKNKLIEWSEKFAPLGMDFNDVVDAVNIVSRISTKQRKSIEDAIAKENDEKAAAEKEIVK